MGCGLGLLSLEVMIISHTGTVSPCLPRGCRRRRTDTSSNLGRTADCCHVSPPSGSMSISYLLFRMTPSLTYDDELTLPLYIPCASLGTRIDRYTYVYVFMCTWVRDKALG